MGRMSHAQFQCWQIARLGTVPNGKFPEVEFKKGQYWKWVPVLEMGMPVPVLANCAFGHLHMYMHKFVHVHAQTDMHISPIPFGT
jgi:hypothetical protein